MQIYLDLGRLFVELMRVLSWPLVAILILLLFRPHIQDVLLRMKKAALPGGFSLDLGSTIAEAREISQGIPTPKPPVEKKDVPRIPLNDVNQRMISLGLQPSPSGLDVTYYRELAQTDPNVALAGLRVEVDLMVRNLANGFKLKRAAREPANTLIRALREESAISDQHYDLIRKILQVCDAAVHGTRVSIDEANDVIGIADKLVEQYISWLSWGFREDWPSQDQ